jgi:hypothetical protein
LSKCVILKQCAGAQHNPQQQRQPRYGALLLNLHCNRTDGRQLVKCVTAK